MQSPAYRSRPKIGGNAHTWNTDAFPDPNTLRGGSEWKLNLSQSFVLSYSILDIDGNPMDMSAQSPAPQLKARPYGEENFSALTLATGIIDADPADGGVVQNRVTFTVPKNWGLNSGLELFGPEFNGAVVIYTEFEDASQYFSIRERLDVEDSEFKQDGQASPNVPISIAYVAPFASDWNKYRAVPTTVEDALTYLAEAGKSDWGNVASATTTAPPGSPVRTDAYLVPNGATGDWAGQDGNYALYDDVALAWTFKAPFEGMIVRAVDTGVEWIYTSSVWVDYQTLIDHAKLLNLTTGNPHSQYALLSGATFSGNIIVPDATLGTEATNLDQVNSLINLAIQGKTDQGVVDQRAVNPPAHGAGVRVLIDANLGSPTGDFVGQENKIANSDGVSVWSFETPSEGWFVWVDDEDKQYSYDADGNNWFASAAGETNTGANVGSGIGTFDGKVLSELQFRSINGLEGILASLNGQTIEVKADFNTLLGHSPIAADTLWIYDSVGAVYKKISFSDLPSANTGATVGTGVAVFDGQVGNVLNFRSILQNANNIVSVQLSGQDVVITVQPADEATVGASRFATDAEVKAGALNTVGVSPLNLLSNFIPRKAELGAAPAGSRTLLASDEGKGVRADNTVVFPVLTEGFQCFVYNITASAITMDLTALSASYINGEEAHTKISPRGMISVLYDSTNVAYINGATEA